MNLNELWPGQDYAYYSHKGRNEPLRRGAPRVKCIRPFKQQRLGNERATGYCEVMYVDLETGEPIMEYDRDTGYNKQKIRTVKARDIAMLWEQYEDEMDHAEVIREKERREYEERERVRREEREARYARQEAERLERERVEQEKLASIRQYFIDRGIPDEWIYNITTEGVHVNRRRVEEALEVTNAQPIRRGWEASRN